ncbi:hypothetical protein SLEP1_g26864 [Rubroshorea leprosula]|uniref:AARP2CN domain-containing protein n=1 Tax=Rubroshorea leprosula TaxID=152421 RepID=A0AAV5JUJ8_9ROSI|nr:hypothetical protein SLEP1_g26864 [Rubroshorea leprosula]
MAGSRVQINKAYKSRFSCKSSRNLHKTSLNDKSRIAKSERNATTKGAREARHQRSKMVNDDEFVLFPHSASVKLNSLAEDILKLLSTEGIGYASSTVASSEYRLRVMVLQAPCRDLLSCMEMAKVADLIAFVASANSLCVEGASDLFDSFGNQCLSVFRSIALPRTKAHSTSLAKSASLPHCTRVPDDSSPGKSTLLLTGYMRAHSLSVIQLVHVSGARDFQLSKIEILKDPSPLNARKEQDAMDSDELNDAKTWPTESEMAEADRNLKQKKQRKRILPHGTSEYQVGMSKTKLP